MKSLFANKELCNRVINAVIVILIIAVIATPLAGTMFTFLSEDDFSYESGGVEGAVQFQSSFVGSLYKTVNIYKGQQGCYTPMFLDHLIRPYSRFGLPGLHVAMFFYVAFCLASIAFICFLMAKNKTVSLAAFLVSVMSFFSMSVTELDKDIVLWHTETLGFTLMLGFLLFGLGFSILSFRHNGVRTAIDIVVASVLAFLASGASLTVTAVNCAVLLAVLILDYRELAKRKFLVIPFLAGFAGALLNAVAPGNFIRGAETITPGHETVFDGFRDSFSCLFKAYPLALDIVFVLAAIALFALCFIYNVEVLSGGISHIRMAIVVVGVFLLQYFETFPAAYGNHYDEQTGHLLIEHVIVTRLTVIFVVMCLAQWIRENFIRKDVVSRNYISKALSNSSFWKVVCVISVLLVLCLPASRNIINNSFTMRTARDFKSGAMVRVYRIREFQLATFEMAEDGSDCIIYTPWDVSSESLPSLGITADSEWLVNRSAANLFGLHTTTVLHP